MTAVIWNSDDGQINKQVRYNGVLPWNNRKQAKDVRRKKKRRQNYAGAWLRVGGEYRSRTDDLLHAMQAL